LVGRVSSGQQGFLKVKLDFQRRKVTYFEGQGSLLTPGFYSRLIGQVWPTQTGVLKKGTGLEAII